MKINNPNLSRSRRILENEIQNFGLGRKLYHLIHEHNTLNKDTAKVKFPITNGIKIIYK